VNIERALRLSDRLDGHLVSGHIDGTGTIASLVRKSNALILKINVPPRLAEDLIEKGSVAIEGISLTINHCTDKDFEVSIIPHTADITTIGQKKVGDEVNIETDMIGKYVKKIILQKSSSKNDALTENKNNISMDLLARNGFL
jgi:riboflavin synthase